MSIQNEPVNVLLLSGGRRVPPKQSDEWPSSFHGCMMFLMHARSTTYLAGSNFKRPMFAWSVRFRKLNGDWERQKRTVPRLQPTVSFNPTKTAVTNQSGSQSLSWNGLFSPPHLSDPSLNSTIWKHGKFRGCPSDRLSPIIHSWREKYAVEVMFREANRSSSFALKGVGNVCSRCRRAHTFWKTEEPVAKELTKFVLGFDQAQQYSRMMPYVYIQGVHASYTVLEFADHNWARCIVGEVFLCLLN